MQKNALKKLFQSHKWDILLGAGLLIVALCLLFVFRKTKETGAYVRVERDGKIVAEYPLGTDGEYSYTSFFGSNTIVIKDGEVYVKNSTCRDHVCEKMGPISKNGEMIICIPNALFITIVSEVEDDYDAVS